MFSMIEYLNVYHTTPSSRASSVSNQTPGNTCTTGDEAMSVSVNESLLSDSSINELSFRSDGTDSSTALAARIELLEAETKIYVIQSEYSSKTTGILSRANCNSRLANTVLQWFCFLSMVFKLLQLSWGCSVQVKLLE